MVSNDRTPTCHPKWHGKYLDGNDNAHADHDEHDGESCETNDPNDGNELCASGDANATPMPNEVMLKEKELECRDKWNKDEKEMNRRNEKGRVRKHRT